jgi:hypothetical protein
MEWNAKLKNGRIVSRRKRAPARKGFFYDIDKIPLFQGPVPDYLSDYFGARILSKEILSVPTMQLAWFKVEPGVRVPHHHHGTNQITFVLKGSLHYGNKVTGPGMGFFNPDHNYSWVAGPEGCEFLEVHDNGAFGTFWRDPPEKWRAHVDWKEASAPRSPKSASLPR